MNRREFRKWFSEFRAAFASVDSWIIKLPASPPDDEYLGATQDGLTAAWFAVLEDVPLESARQAMHKMNRGDLPGPLAFQDYPREIRHAALKLVGKKREHPPGPTIVGGVESADCRFCMDEGLVTIFTVEAMRAMRDGAWDDEFRHRHSTCVVRCFCKWGQSFRWQGDWPIFDSNKMVRCEQRPPNDADVERLEQFFAGRATQDSYA